MGNWSSCDVKCKCCEEWYASGRYSEKGDLCSKCASHYRRNDRGRLEEEYSPDEQRSPSPTVDSKKCFCCERYYKPDEIKNIRFLCRIPDHSILLCKNCGKLQIDSIRCQVDKQQPDQGSIERMSRDD